MSSLSTTASWVIVRLEDNKPMFETFNQALTQAINKQKYKAVPILEYLQEFNRKVKNDY